MVSLARSQTLDCFPVSIKHPCLVFHSQIRKMAKQGSQILGWKRPKWLCISPSPRSDIWSYSTARLSIIIKIITSILEGLLFDLLHENILSISQRRTLGFRESLVIPSKNKTSKISSAWSFLCCFFFFFCCLSGFLGLVRCQHASQEAWQEGELCPWGAWLKVEAESRAAHLLGSVGKRKREQRVGCGYGTEYIDQRLGPKGGSQSSQSRQRKQCVFWLNIWLNLLHWRNLASRWQHETNNSGSKCKLSWEVLLCPWQSGCLASSCDFWDAGFSTSATWGLTLVSLRPSGQVSMS